MQLRVFLLLVTSLLFFNCSSSEERAGFGSVTTNGGTATVLISGDSTYEGDLYIIPVQFNPTTDSLPEENIIKLTGSEHLSIDGEFDEQYNIYIKNSTSGKMGFLKSVFLNPVDTLEVTLSEPGNVRIHFEESNQLIDTTNGALFFNGFIASKKLQGNIQSEGKGFSVLFDSLPANLSDSLFYTVHGSNSYTQSIGKAELSANKTFDLYAKILYQFITTQYSLIPSDTVQSIISSGEQLWLATPVGLSTLEESDLTSETAPWKNHENEKISALLSPSPSLVFYATAGAVYRMRIDPSKNCYSALVIDSIGEIFDMTQDRMGALWIATSQGLYKTYNGMVKHFDRSSHNFPCDTITVLAIDSTGTIVGGTNKGLLFLYSDGSSKTVTADMTPVLHSNQITALEVDRNNALWVGTRGGGITKCTKQYWYSYFEPLYKIYATTTVTDIVTTAEGITWVSTESGFLLHGKDEQWNLFLGQGGIIPGYPINRIAIGANGSILCGTKGAGIFVIGPSENFKNENRI